MSGWRLSLVAGLSLLGACTRLPWREMPVAKDAGELLRQAEVLHAQGRWEDALARLREGRRWFPDDARIATLSEKWRGEWRQQRATLEDRLRATDAEALLTRRRLLAKLEAAERFDPLNQSRLALLDANLKTRRPGLIDCAKRQRGIAGGLARRCARLVARIGPGEDIPKLTSAAKRKKKRARKVEKRSDARNAGARVSPRGAPTAATPRDALAKLLDEARDALDEGALLDALVALDQARALNPEDARYLRLRARFRLEVAPRVDALDALGNRLYRDERLQPALTVWRLARRLAPDDTELAAKIERAERVAAKLRRIRSRRPLDAGAPPASSSSPTSDR